MRADVLYTRSREPHSCEVRTSLASVMRPRRAVINRLKFKFHPSSRCLGLFCLESWEHVSMNKSRLSTDFLQPRCRRNGRGVIHYQDCLRKQKLFVPVFLPLPQIDLGPDPSPRPSSPFSSVDKAVGTSVHRSAACNVGVLSLGGEIASMFCYDQ